ncbi:TPA: alpha/beta hydrolase [Vibrio cholerae]|nr:alpha/beta hydrolase [Vibrio cholerae]HDG1730556.1 alpha/beta hydrolase [Vibrio cholerae]
MIDNIYYYDSDPDNFTGKPVILFLHGFFMNHKMFDHQIEYFSESFRIIAPDFKCFGKSAPKVEQNRFNEWVDDIINLLNTLQVESYCVVGMSMGGYVAQRLCVKDKHRILKAVFMSTQAGKDNPETIEQYLTLVNNWGDFSLRENIISSLKESFFGECSKETEYWEDLWMDYDDRTLSSAMKSMISRDDFISQLKNIKCPVLILHGDKDQGIPVSAARKMHKDLINSKLRLIIDGRHAINITHHEIVNAEIDLFFK